MKNYNFFNSLSELVSYSKGKFLGKTAAVSFASAEKLNSEIKIHSGEKEIILTFKSPDSGFEKKINWENIKPQIREDIAIFQFDDLTLEIQAMTADKFYLHMKSTLPAANSLLFSGMLERKKFRLF